MNKNKERCKKCIHRCVCLYQSYYDNVDHLGERCRKYLSKEKIDGQKAEIEELQKDGETLAISLLNAKAEIERLQCEVKEKTETIDFLKNQVVGWGKDYCKLKSFYVDLKAENIKTIKAIKQAKAEAVKEFWNQRPPQLNPIQKGKELYNQGWNDCISFFAEEYEIFLGIKKRNEEMVGDV